MIAQEVMSFKASKQAAFGLNGAQLGRKASLSAPDRDSLSQQRQQNNNRNSMYEYGAASQHAAIPSSSMEVDDQLEQELGGFVNENAHRLQ